MDPLNHTMDPFNHRHQEPIRNSGHMGGRFSEKRRIKNPATGEYFKLSEPWLHSQLLMFPGLQSDNESVALPKTASLRTCLWGRRWSLRRSHSASPVLMSTAYNTLRLESLVKWGSDADIETETERIFKPLT